MNAESENENKLESDRFLISRGFNPEELLIDYFHRHRRFDPSMPVEYNMHDTMKETKVRWEFIDKFGFAILSLGAVEAIRPYQPLLELGAGSGYWSYELKRFGIDVIATDPFDQETVSRSNTGMESKGDKVWEHRYTEIEQLAAVDAIRKYPSRNLLIVWPSLWSSWAAGALEVYTGNTVIYFGENQGDACADDRFFELLDERFADRTYVPMPHFWGCHDRWLLIARKPKQLWNQ